MKKQVFLIVILLLLGASIFGSPDNLDNYKKINSKLSYLADYSNQEIYDLSQLSSNFTSNQKQTLYAKNKVKILLPFLLNTFVGLGTGSYVQGDTEGGTITLVGMITSFSLFSMGYGVSLLCEENVGLNCFILTSLTAALGFKIYGIIRTFTYAFNYNKKLSKALNYVAVTPKLADENNLNFNFSFTIPLS